MGAEGCVGRHFVVGIEGVVWRDVRIREGSRVVLVGVFDGSVFASSRVDVWLNDRSEKRGRGSYAPLPYYTRAVAVLPRASS